MKKQKQIMNRKPSHVNRKNFGKWFDCIVIVVFVVIFGFFFQKAILKTSNHVDLAKQTKQLYTQTNQLKADRGIIYDDANQPLAEDSNTYSIYAVLNREQKTDNNKPAYVTNPKKTARVLSQHLPIKYGRALAILTPKEPAFQVEFGTPGRNISMVDKEKIEAAHLPGINFTQQQSRIYPNGVYASHIIGLAEPSSPQSDNPGTLTGTLGLEKSLNSYLSGKNGYRKTRKDNFGYQVADQNQKERAPQNGDNVHTTFDSRLEALLENQMTKVQNQVHPKVLNAVLMDAKTGKILAAGQRPTFNATTKNGIGSIWRDTLTQDVYEPGSTMKIFTLASSIDSGHFNGNNTFRSGRYSVDGKTVPDWNPNGWGRISYNKGFALSSNVLMAHLEQEMGPKVWRNYINRFHLLDNTDSVLGDDSSGSIQFKYPIEQANTAFGQGIDVTVLSMLQGLTAIANNGKMIKPRFVSEITNDKNNKVVKKYNKQTIGYPIKPQTAKEVRKHMEDVVYKSYGIGHDYQMKGYRVAAKTGTAQVANSSGQYQNGDDSYLYSVAGMVPAKNPRYIMYVTMRQPRLNGKKTPTQFMAEIFNVVMRRALKQAPVSQNIPNVLNQPVKKAKEAVSAKNMKPVIIGSGDTVEKQGPTAGYNSQNGNSVILVTNGDSKQMPNIKGWDQKDVKTLCGLLHLKLKSNGNGRVVTQSIKQGDNLADYKSLKINL